MYIYITTLVKPCARQARDRGLESHSGQFSIWNRKTLAQNEYKIYRSDSKHI